MEAQNYPLDEQVETLQMLGRNDAASILEGHLGSSRETSTRYEDTDLWGRKHVGQPDYDLGPIHIHIHTCMQTVQHDRTCKPQTLSLEKKLRIVYPQPMQPTPEF